MDIKLNEELIPEGLRDIYRQVYTSANQVDDERVRLALISVMDAIRKDVTGEAPDLSDGSNVVEFVRPEPRSAARRLAESR